MMCLLLTSVMNCMMTEVFSYTVVMAQKLGQARWSVWHLFCFFLCLVDRISSKAEVPISLINILLVTRFWSDAFRYMADKYLI